MIRILDIALKDLLQLMRERSTFLFLLIMPVLFTFLFGYAFGGFDRGSSDPRLPVGFVDEDQSRVSRELYELLAASDVLRVENSDSETLERRVAEGELAAGIRVPPEYGRRLLSARETRLILIADPGSTAKTMIESEVLSTVIRLESALRTAAVLEDLAGDQAPFEYVYRNALERWEQPPIRVAETTSSAINQSAGEASENLAHTAPGMMLQFAIAGLLTAAQVLVTERRSGAMARLRTTATARWQILLGHYVALFALLFTQFVLLILFGQWVLQLNYLAQPAAVLVITLASALCIAALGLLIGVFAKSEEQAVIFSLIPMFILAGLGGAWVPLEVTGETFRTIGHFSPIAWGMDGYKNILIRGMGLEGVLLPAAALAGYALLFFTVAAWRFRKH